ncbi:phage antirepressor KilAC domain-containing protein [Effusibacillus dendaii]|uniref:Antirepressor n=1 Tax=Effusibacillus dendaii TaxID=2743772 RepID=A0A7I8DD95_9BACL|nr:phage antirepressor [Effusibacillus dendaii]BCJ86500.1 antirepressor [Effusibacillus dendaii]
MDNLPQIFNHPAFGNVELLVEGEKFWFGATDVGLALGYSNPQKAVRDHCRADGCTIRSVIDSLGREQQKRFIDEGNLYRLITKSKLPDAEKFESWVFDEVIPSVRKHGAYMTPGTLEKALTSPDFLIQLATKLKEERQARLAAEKKIQLDKPKVIFAEALEISSNTILVGELAKLLKQNGVEIGQNRLFEWLRKEGYLGSKGEYYNLPTQKSMELGLFEIKTTTVNNPDGSVRVTKTPKVTGKGQIYFINKFKQELVGEKAV